MILSGILTMDEAYQSIEWRSVFLIAAMLPLGTAMELTGTAAYLARGVVDTLGGIARETSRIRLGTLVTSATFRLPGPLAISVAQVDEMANGRVELGLGAGWYQQEHEAYGIEFPPLGEAAEPDGLLQGVALVGIRPEGHVRPHRVDAPVAIRGAG